MSTKLNRFLALSAIGVAVMAGNAQAAYSNLVVFGDSISDTGNVLSLTNAFGQPPFPSFPGAAGRFSDGPAWVEYLAAGLGLPNGAVNSNKYLNGGNVINIGIPGGGNYAFGGARTGMDGAAGLPNTGLFAQLTAWNGSTFAGALERAADPNALYVVVAGANDLRDIRSNGALTLAQKSTAAAAVAQSVVYSVSLLAQAGAQHFLISSLPDLGKTPEANYLNFLAGSTGPTTASTAVTLSFNSALAAQSAGLDSIFQSGYGRDLDIRTLDFYGLFESVVAAAGTASPVGGITNVTMPCITPGAGSGQYFFADATGTNCSTSAFSDPLHPSSKSQQLLGQAAVLAAIPEPSSMAMLAIGLLVIGGAVRRARAAT